MINRLNPKSPQSAAVKTRAQMEALIREIAALKLGEKLLAASLDAELQSVRDNYETRLAPLAQSLAEKTERARAWAESNPGEFAGRRSIEFAHGVAGFRTGAPKLKTVLRWKWDGVLEALRGARWGKTYLRVKEEINKEQIIADFGAGILGATDLRKAGAQVVQEESFFVEPKFTRVEPREVAAAA